MLIPGQFDGTELDPTLEANRDLAKYLFSKEMEMTRACMILRSILSSESALISILLVVAEFVVNNSTIAKLKYAVVFNHAGTWRMQFPGWLIQYKNWRQSRACTAVPLSGSPPREFKVLGAERMDAAGAYVIDKDAEDGFFTTELVELMMLDVGARVVSMAFEDDLLGRRDDIYRFFRGR
jgi:hypothetical protein